MQDLTICFGYQNMTNISLPFILISCLIIAIISILYLITNQTPTYQFKVIDGIEFLEVKTGYINDEKIDELILEEARKSSLMGMALIQKLAQKNLGSAKQIANLYQGYRKFIEDHNNEKFSEICNEIMHNPHSSSLALQAALFIHDMLRNQNAEQNEGSILIKRLMPFIETTLKHPLLQKLVPEQLVSTPEMQATHNAFPDIIKFSDSYFVCFREGNSHVGYQDFGKIRILKGLFDNNTKSWVWENVALLEKQSFDLRDPKFFIDSTNTLHMMINASIIDKDDSTQELVPHVATLTNDGWTLSKAELSTLREKGEWIWSLTWNQKSHVGYGFSYAIDPQKNSVLYLMKTKDGLQFEKIAEVSTDALAGEALTEATIRFKDDGSAIALIRSQRHALVGISKPESDYQQWLMNVIPFRIGGPNFIVQKKSNKMWACTRYIFLNADNSLDDATVLAVMDEKQLAPILRLRSHGDTGYAGIIEEDQTATIIYYTSDSDKSQIFITRISFVNEVLMLHKT